MELPLDQQNLIGILGIESLPEERKLDLLNKVTVLVEKRLMIRIFDSLPEADQNTFTQLLDKEDQAGINEFLAAKAPNLADWLQEETNTIKEELAGAVKDIE